MPLESTAMRLIAAPLATLLVPAALHAQDPAPVYQQGKQYSLEFKLDAVSRQEWTDDIAFTEGDRRMLRLKPRVELGFSRLLVGVGGDFTLSTDENTVPPSNVRALPLLRDNYDSRDARLDLAFLRVDPASWLRVQGGRLPMPVRFTEMIWDRDLRPQGAAVTLQAGERGALRSIGVTGLWARGSHVFPQDEGEEGAGTPPNVSAPFDFTERETVLSAAAHATLGRGAGSNVELVAAFVTFRDLGHLDPRLRRQNTRVSAGGPVRFEYDVVDLVARYQRTTGLEFQLVADYCWNTAVDADNRGLWLAAVIGSTKSARARLEYVYARVDKDATLAAFPADDFLWTTGWEGHRADLGIRLSDHAAVHGVAQRQRFKDSANAAERDVWLDRYRVELRWMP
jgi:hypothetical protein